MVRSVWAFCWGIPLKITTSKTLPVESVSRNAAIKKQVMLRMGEVPHLTNFSQARFQPGQVVVAHALTPGVCVAVAPSESHEVFYSGEVELVLTYFGLKD